jgi:hypothetical protein
VSGHARRLNVLLTSDTVARAAAGGSKGQNRRAGGRWQRAAPVGCAVAHLARLRPYPPSH